MTPYLGQLAALGASVVWSLTSIFFTFAARRVGSTVVNRTRLLLAMIFVSAMHWVLEGQPFPFGAEPFRFGWLALSGVIGYVIGDGFLFQAFVLIGPRLTWLLMALAPVFSAVGGLVLFQQMLAPREWLGVLVTLGGVALVLSDRQLPDVDEVPITARHYGLGILFGLGAALGQASGLVASKFGLEGDFPALSGNLIRLAAAALAIWVIALLRGELADGFGELRQHPRAFGAITGGAIAGPFVGVWFSLIAIQLAPLGIAATLMSLTPVILLPLGHFLYRERIGPRAIVGTLAAVGGTVILFL